MRALRRTALVVFATIVVTTGCSAAQDLAEEVGTAADELRSEVAVPPADEAPGEPGQPQTEGGSGPTAPGSTDAPPTEGGSGGEDPPPEDVPGTSVDDRGGVGANGRALLRGDVPNLVVEVDVQEGVAPSRGALEHLTSVIAGVADKPGGISFVGGNTFASDRTSWSRSDLVSAAAEHRSQFSGGGTVAVHILYVRGRFVRDGEDTGALGVAYSASEFAVFPEGWTSLTTGLLGGSDAIERAVLVHEIGHLFGLVNLTYTSPIDHEDPEHPGHSDNRGSVMFWAIESDAIAQVFNGPPPDRFDDADRQDLEGLRSGRL